MQYFVDLYCINIWRECCWVCKIPVLRASVVVIDPILSSSFAYFEAWMLLIGVARIDHCMLDHRGCLVGLYGYE
jgi:hypothetical protein